MTSDGEGFIRSNTRLRSVPLVPEIFLHMADEITPIWQASERWLAAHNVAPPFWAFAWPGGQGLARHILDNPALVAGRRVLDFAAGSGVVAIACARAGAAQIEAAEIDSLAVIAIGLNAAANGVDVITCHCDMVGASSRWDLIVCGDVCYEASMTDHIMPWLTSMTTTTEVWLADPGRNYLPTDSLTPFACYTVPTTLEIEDRIAREVVLYRLGL